MVRGSTGGYTPSEYPFRRTLSERVFRQLKNSDSPFTERPCIHHQQLLLPGETDAPGRGYRKASETGLVTELLSALNRFFLTRATMIEAYQFRC